MREIKYILSKLLLKNVRKMTELILHRFDLLRRKAILKLKFSYFIKIISQITKAINSYK